MCIRDSFTPFNSDPLVVGDNNGTPVVSGNGGSGNQGHGVVQFTDLDSDLAIKLISFTLVDAGGANNLTALLHPITYEYTPDLDSDNDGTINRIDTDSDQDGIADNIEAQNGQPFVPLSGVDANNDGLDDFYEVAPGTVGFNPDGIGLLPTDTDFGTATVDYNPDFIDTDSNGDGTLDRDGITIDASTISDLESNATTLVGTSSDVDAFVLADGASLTLDLTLIANANITDVERFDISGDSDNVLTLELSDLLDLSSTSDQLIVFGDAGDTVNAAGFTDAGVSETIDGVVYDTYTSGAGTLLVEESVTVVILSLIHI